MKLGDRELTNQDIEVLLMGLAGLRCAMTDPVDNVRRQLFMYIKESLNHAIPEPAPKAKK